MFFFFKNIMSKDIKEDLGTWKIWCEDYMQVGIEEEILHLVSLDTKDLLNLNDTYKKK